MKRLLFAAALWLAAGPTVVQSVHALLHEHGVAHVHNDDGDEHHDEHDSQHESLLAAPQPAALAAAPRVEGTALLELAFAPAAALTGSGPRAATLAAGPPRSPPGRLVSAVPSNRAPPA